MRGEKNKKKTPAISAAIPIHPHGGRYYSTLIRHIAVWLGGLQTATVRLLRNS